MELEAASLVVGALAAGATQGLQDTAGAAVLDVYTRLRDLITTRFRGHREAETALEGYAEDPQTWQELLVESLRETGSLGDPAVLETAGQLMSLLDPEGAADGRYVVRVHNSQGIQVNHRGGNVQTNTFHS
ncbi:hypothetical protein ACFVWX_32920 [Streptomyces sp. NPDC058220]|uniref:hypothetical protein n=1 Tax=unclassified Streptomyces TaxID=2593676 RepID=UPI003650A97F